MAAAPSRWTQRLAAEFGFALSKLTGRRHQLALTLLDQPVRLDIAARRELVRAFSIDLEASFVRRILEHLRPHDVIYDIGANVGVITTLLALHPAGRECRVHSFEPEPRNHAQLVRNLALNHLTPRATPHATALGDQAGEAALFVRGTAGEGRHSMVAKTGATGEITVPVTTASAFAAACGMPPDVVKIDVEGAEGRVLAGMATLLRTTRPRELFMEIHDKGDRDRMPDGTTIHDTLTAHGYTLAWRQQRRSGVHVHYR